MGTNSRDERELTVKRDFKKKREEARQRENHVITGLFNRHKNIFHQVLIRSLTRHGQHNNKNSKKNIKYKYDR